METDRGRRVLDLRDGQVALPATGAALPGSAGAGVGREDPLERLSAALGSPLKLKGALQMIARWAVEEAGPNHASVFLLDGHRLHPAVGVGRQSDEEVWAVFRSMGPIDVDPERWALFSGDQAIVIEDAQASRLIPPAWIERFSVRSVVLVALRPGGEPAGLLAADWSEVHEFSPDELALLRRLGSYAAMAIGYTRPFQRVSRQAQLQGALARAAGSLGAPLEPREILVRVIHACSELLGPRCCVAAALVDPERSWVTNAASQGTRELHAPFPLAMVPDRVRVRLERGWGGGAHLIELGDDPWLARALGVRRPKVARYAALPLLSSGKPCGGVLLGFGEHVRLDAEERGAVLALAAYAGAALDRHRLLDHLADRVHRLDLLYRVSAAFTERADASGLLAALQRLLADDGIDIVGVTFRARRLREYLGGAAPSREERTAWQVGQGAVELGNGMLSVPMRLGRRVAGALRVRPVDLPGDDLALLEALGAELVEVANRGAQRRAIEQAERQSALLEERDRFRVDLHDSAGQLFVGIRLLTARLLESLPAGSESAEQAARIVALAGQGTEEIDHTIRALSFAPVAPGGLVPSLDALAGRFADDSGLRVELLVAGRAVPLAAKVESALYRVAHEALTNAWRHARGDAVTVELSFGPAEVCLAVHDDGIGFPEGGPASTRRTGLASMTRAIQAVGGSLRVVNAAGGGGVVEAVVPRERH